MKAPQEAPANDAGMVEAHLLLGRGGVIAGEVVGGESPRPFHGWLELMDALDEIRSTPGEPGGANRKEEQG